MLEIERLGFGVKDAAAICGLSDAQLKGWRQSGLCADRGGVGTGHPVVFTLGDLMRIALCKRLVALGIGATDAARAATGATPYGQFLEGREHLTFVRTETGVLTSIAGPRPGEAFIAVPLGQLFAEVFAGIAKRLFEQAGPSEEQRLPVLLVLQKALDLLAADHRRAAELVPQLFAEDF